MMHISFLLLPLLALQVYASFDRKTNQEIRHKWIPDEPKPRPCKPRKFWVDCTELAPGKYEPNEYYTIGFPAVIHHVCQDEYGIGAWSPLGMGTWDRMGCYYSNRAEKVVIYYTAICCPSKYQELVPNPDIRWGDPEFNGTLGLDFVPDGNFWSIFGYDAET
ncbi:hypothetical protein HRS9139_06908 [Pyrenophora teres f. teres]|nr:hypothetical protein HRS9139_06908 [Pyrenophora teres f. teres]KAE8859478.1 hypothetical protein PTNB29_06709 [Pyrenophora teres f. teres]